MFPRIFDDAQSLAPDSASLEEVFALAGGVPPINMTVPDQRKDEWCWAASCAGVREAFEHVANDPCILAGEVLTLSCCQDPDSCNRAMALSVALDRLGYFAPPIEDQLDFAAIAAEIQNGNPVCCFIDYGTPIGHFIVISAVDAESESVGVLDPAPNGPHSEPQFIPLVSLRAGYKSGQWRETYRTKPRS